MEHLNQHVQFAPAGLRRSPSSGAPATTRGGRVPLRARAALLASLLAQLTLACSVDDSPERLGFSSDTVVAAASPEEPLRPVNFLGRWRGRAYDVLELPTTASGEVEPFQFPSGSSDITLEISIGISFVEGELVFGAAEAPPVTSPYEMYPPGTTFADYDTETAILEGTRYEIGLLPFESQRPDADGPEYERSLADADGILRLGFSTANAYSEWCAVQPSLPSITEMNVFNCLGALGFDQAADGKCYTFDSDADFLPRSQGSRVIPNPEREVDCARASACMDQCICIPPEFVGPVLTTACRYGRQGSGAQLLLRQAGDDELVGVFTGAASFVNRRGARTTLERVVFQRIAEP